MWIPESTEVPRSQYQVKEVVEDPRRLMRKILRQNKRQLRQTKRTPFAKKRWRRKLEIDGRGEYVERILAGKAKCKKEEEYMRKYIKGLAST